MACKTIVDTSSSEHIISEDYHGQRLDNYLLREWRKVPRDLVYRLIRTGKVRVNERRVKPDNRLTTGDRLMIPIDVKIKSRIENHQPMPLALEVIYEDSDLMMVNKPHGLASHGGSGIAFGVIERLRANMDNYSNLELVHRLDRDTSGLLLLAKKRSMLRVLQQQWRDRQVIKNYQAIVFGHWEKKHRHIQLPIKRSSDFNHTMKIADDGKAAMTKTALQKQASDLALISATIITGRTHQLRVHLAANNLPIVGDRKYGHFEKNRKINQRELDRMFLHAESLQFQHPRDERLMVLNAPLPPEFQMLMNEADSLR